MIVRTQADLDRARGWVRTASDEYLRSVAANDLRPYWARSLASEELSRRWASLHQAVLDLEGSRVL
jgi:hypothetical protein